MVTTASQLACAIKVMHTLVSQLDLAIEVLQISGSWTVHVYCNSSAAMHSEKMFKTEAETFLVTVKMNVAIFQLLG